MAVPLGNAREVFGEERQISMAVPGYLLETGGPVITYYYKDYVHIYDRKGQLVYQYPVGEGLLAIDGRNNFYTVNDLGILTKYDPQGKRVSSFRVVAGPSPEVAIEMVTREGLIYALIWDFETQDTYRVVLWQRK